MKSSRQADTNDPHANRRDVKHRKKNQPQDNRKSIQLIAKLSSKSKKK